MFLSKDKLIYCTTFSRGFQAFWRNFMCFPEIFMRFRPRLSAYFREAFQLLQFPIYDSRNYITISLHCQQNAILSLTIYRKYCGLKLQYENWAPLHAKQFPVDKYCKRWYNISYVSTDRRAHFRCKLRSPVCMP